MKRGGVWRWWRQVIKWWSAEHGWRGTKAVAKPLRAAQSGSEPEKSGLAPEPEPLHQLSCWSWAVSGLSRAVTTLHKGTCPTDSQQSRYYIYPVPSLTWRKAVPPWVIPYWIHLHNIYETKAMWKLAVSRLRNHIETEDHTSDLLHQAFNALCYTPWAGHIEGGEWYIDSPLLSMLFTDAWLMDKHVAVMLDLLKEDLRKEGAIRQILVEEPTFFQCLIATYDDWACYTTDRSYVWLQKKGEDLAAGCTGPLVSIPNKGGVHWIVLVIDFEDQIIHYGDALDNSFTRELKDVIEWWTWYHTQEKFEHRRLPITFQLDSFSCSIFLWNALQSFLIPSGPLLMDTTKGLDECLKLFLCLVKKYYNHVSYLIFAWHHTAYWTHFRSQLAWPAMVWILLIMLMALPWVDQKLVYQ